MAADTRAQVVVTALGDSLTAGWGLPDGAAYPEVLERMLHANGFDVRILNAGVSGDTSAGGLARLGWTLRDEPDGVIVALGANDGLRGLSTRLLENNLESIIERLRRENVAVLLAGMKAPPNMGPGYTSSFNAIYPRLAQKYDTYFYPFLLQGVAGDRSLNLPDGIHPNEEGARAIAENLYPVVKEMVRDLAARKQAASGGE